MLVGHFFALLVLVLIREQKKPSLGATAGKRGCTILIQPIDASSGFHRFIHHGGQACSNFVNAPAICDKV
jgi:hypothetical protein